MNILRFLLIKEFKQFFRNRFLLRVFFALPVMVMLILPWATQMDCKNITVGVVDQDHSTMSQGLITKIDASSYFQFQGIFPSYEEALSQINKDQLDLIVEIPVHFEQQWMRGEGPALQLSVNAVNSAKGGLGANYMGHTISDFNQEQVAALGVPTLSDSFISVQNRFNPYLDYKFYMIPALMTMLVIILGGFMPAMNIIREKESGTIEQMNVSPVGRKVFILSKLLPYWLLVMVVLTLCILISWAVYGLFPVGNIGLIYLAATLLMLGMAGMGLLIANFSDTMQQTIFVMYFIIMVFMLMSGLFTPIHSMPEWAQSLTTIVPPRYFINIMRDLYLKGSTFADEWINFLALSGLGILIGIAAVLSYRKQE